MANKVEKEKPSENKSQKLASLAFEIFSEGFSFSTLLVISPSLFPGLTFPLFHGSSFPSLLFIPLFPLFYDPSFLSLLFMPFFPLFHGSSFPFLLFIPFFHDLQTLPSSPCPLHIDPALWIQGIESKQSNLVHQNNLGLEIGQHL